MAALDHFPSGMTPRLEQKTAIGAIEAALSRNTVVAFQGPTGSGKSAIAMTHARHARAQGQKSYLLSIQKILQDQYWSQWPSPEIEAMKGRSNYECTYDPALSKDASRGYCRRVKKSSLIQKCLTMGTVEEAQHLELPVEAHLCPYWAQMQRTIKNPIALFNFHSFLFQQRLGRFGPRDFMVLDECHQTENVLLQFVEIILSDETLSKFGVRLDLRLTTAKSVIDWLDRERVEEKIFEALGSAAATEDAAENLSPEETDRLRALLERLSMLRKFMALTEWVVDVTEEPDEGQSPLSRTRKLRIRPVFISLFANDLIFSKASKTLAMSATILDPKIWARNLGLSQKNVSYIEAPCTFPVENRPIIKEYAGNMSWKTLQETLPKLYQVIEKIMERHKGERGIIHAHSERLVRLITENVASPRFVHLGLYKTRDKAALLKDHSLMKDSVIIASGLHEGIDLHDELARFQVIAKIPWPGMDDAFVKARMSSDGSFLPYQTSLKFLQSCGRGVRHETDWTVTYVVDSGFERFLSSCGWLLPKWFVDAIE